MSDTLRIDRILSNSGYGTRKEIKKLIRDGDVSVDGNITNDPGIHINPENHIIHVKGQRINYRKYVYIMMNKPAGVITSTEDKRENTVIGLLPQEYAEFKPSPAGRLDKDTVGLLLITNDGYLIHKLISPANHVSKVYYARIKGMVCKSDVDDFKNGVMLDDGYKAMPANLRIIAQGDESEVEVEIFEGKYHQVKRMFEAIGKKVLFLMRISMGPIKLDPGLKPGEFRELTPYELKSLTACTN